MIPFAQSMLLARYLRGEFWMNIRHFFWKVGEGNVSIDNL